MLVGQALDLNVFEAFRVEVPADLFGDIEGVLPWHQPEIDLGGCGGRQDGLGSGALVAGGNAGDGAGGMENGRFLELEAGDTVEKAGQIVHLAVGVFVGRLRSQHLAVSLRGWDDVIVEAGYPDRLIWTL